MVRHLKRLTLGIDEALNLDILDQNSLSLLQPYQPNISVTWLFQKTMSVEVHQTVSPNQINDLMSGVFQVMDQLGDDVLKPFLQDVIQFPALMKTLPLVNPKLVLPILPKVGVKPDKALADSIRNYVKTRLEAHAYPRAVEFLKEMPMTKTGKILKQELRRMHEKGLLGSGFKGS